MRVHPGREAVARRCAWPIRLALLAVGLFGVLVGAHSQALNIDFDIGFGGPDVGNGAPSDSFGAAAGQAGRWNRIPFSPGPFALYDTQGLSTGGVMTIVSTGPSGYFTGGYAFSGNTGDFALLLNDAGVVGTIVQGGSKRFTFAGLGAGAYDVFTYAVRISGEVSPTPVFVEHAVINQTQVVTGPMPGDAFQYLVTHSIHRVNLSPGETFDVYIEQPPNTQHGYEVNGFQIVPVPELSSGACLVLLLTVLLFKRPLR